VLDAIKANGLRADVIYACGPTPMLKAIKAYAAENGIECYISLEEKMACGIGACLGCVCHTKEVDEHSNVRNTRICKDGPVFLADDVELLTVDEQRERIASGCMCATVKVKED
jgi:dihydroorotate dehydrogenase electron transfer subunit